MDPSVRIWLSLIFCLLFLPQCSEKAPEKQNTARFIKKINWIGKGQWLKADLHTHTTFSDGKFGVDELVSKAADFGCDVLAITDHNDRSGKSATPEYFEAIEDARALNSDMLIFSGLEWNIPPYDDQEHMTVLLPFSEETSLLPEFKNRFDDYRRRGDRHGAPAALKWLEEVSSLPVMIYNHPSRLSGGAERIVRDLRSWHDASTMLIGFSGAPGHQRGGSKGIGAYDQGDATVDRWDPAVAVIGGIWDKLLGTGRSLWAARAGSDFHRDNAAGYSDYWPGQFSETWLYVPERSDTGVLRALRAGSFFAAHGHIAREVKLEVMADGLPRAAQAGETINVAPGDSVVITLSFKVPASDWETVPNRIDQVEIIGITRQQSQSLAVAVPVNGRFHMAMEVPRGGMVLRARGRRVIEDEPDLLFYTNPVRIED